MYLVFPLVMYFVSSDKLKVEPENEADESGDPHITPQMNLYLSMFSPIFTASINNKNMSMRWWSGSGRKL